MDCMVPEMSLNKTAKTYMKLLRYERDHFLVFRPNLAQIAFT